MGCNDDDDARGAADGCVDGCYAGGGDGNTLNMRFCLLRFGAFGP